MVEGLAPAAAFLGSGGKKTNWVHLSAISFFVAVVNFSKERFSPRQKRARARSPSKLHCWILVVPSRRLSAMKSWVLVLFVERLDRTQGFR